MDDHLYLRVMGLISGRRSGVTIMDSINNLVFGKERTQRAPMFTKSTIIIIARATVQLEQMNT